jgi:hypothetical protein
LAQYTKEDFMSFSKISAQVAVSILALFVCGLAHAQTANVPLYNAQAQPLPLNQMVAGQNAPSYSYNQPGGTQPYSFGATNTNTGGGFYAPQGTLTPEQEAALAQQIAQQEFLIEQQMQMNMQGQGGLGAQLNALNQSPFFNQNNDIQKQPGQRVVKRVVRNALNDPLSPPPRLFNPDQ